MTATITLADVVRIAATTTERPEHPPITLEHAVRILSAYRAEVRARSAEAEEEGR